MSNELKALIDDAIALMRSTASWLETEGWDITPVNMRKLCDELDKELAK